MRERVPSLSGLEENQKSEKQQERLTISTVPNPTPTLVLPTPIPHDHPRIILDLSRGRLEHEAEDVRLLRPCSRVVVPDNVEVLALVEVSTAVEAVVGDLIPPLPVAQSTNFAGPNTRWNSSRCL